jgi:prepilin-type N-terminal cleavage/methylation domain-containing protein
MSVHDYKHYRLVNSGSLVFTPQHGFSLVELMVALLLGVFMVLALTTVLTSSQQSFGTSSLLAGVQENGQLAKNMLVNDLKRARYMGKNIDLNASNTKGTLGATTVAASCNNDTSWGRMVEQSLFGLDDNEGLSGLGNDQDALYACITSVADDATGVYMTGDILTVRYASPWKVTTFEANRLYIRGTLTSSWIFDGVSRNHDDNDEIVVGGGTSDLIKSTHELLAYSYYVGSSGRKCLGDVIPSLFRVRLDKRGKPLSEELFPGIYDLQVTYTTDGVSYLGADDVNDWDTVIATQFVLKARSECKDSGEFRRATYSSTIRHRN